MICTSNNLNSLAYGPEGHKSSGNRLKYTNLDVSCYKRGWTSQVPCSSFSDHRLFSVCWMHSTYSTFKSMTAVLLPKTSWPDFPHLAAPGTPDRPSVAFLAHLQGGTWTDPDRLEAAETWIPDTPRRRVTDSAGKRKLEAPMASF